METLVYLAVKRQCEPPHQRAACEVTDGVSLCAFVTETPFSPLSWRFLFCFFFNATKTFSGRCSRASFLTLPQELCRKFLSHTFFSFFSLVHELMTLMSGFYRCGNHLSALNKVIYFGWHFQARIACVK